ncbi:MAG: hypothetical protein U9N76_08130, partial [Candidatus Marinimicrobia bacterium]|nr:hypothetical protein [Candidatus Neomarinimicrobiota bacterium]
MMINYKTKNIRLVLLFIMLLLLYNCQDPSDSANLRSPDGITPVVTGFYETDASGNILETYGTPSESNQDIQIDNCESAPVDTTYPFGVFPMRFYLHTPFPNPCNLSTSIYFDIACKVDIVLFVVPAKLPHEPTSSYTLNSNGINKIAEGLSIRTIYEKKDGMPGYYPISWDGRDDYGNEVSSGFYRIYLKINEYYLWRDVLFFDRNLTNHGYYIN